MHAKNQNISVTQWAPDQLLDGDLSWCYLLQCYWTTGSHLKTDTPHGQKINRFQTSTRFTTLSKRRPIILLLTLGASFEFETSLVCNGTHIRIRTHIRMIGICIHMPLPTA